MKFIGRTTRLKHDYKPEYFHEKHFLSKNMLDRKKQIEKEEKQMEKDKQAEAKKNVKQEIDKISKRKKAQQAKNKELQKIIAEKSKKVSIDLKKRQEEEEKKINPLLKKKKKRSKVTLNNLIKLRSAADYNVKSKKDLKKTLKKSLLKKTLDGGMTPKRAEDNVNIPATARESLPMITPTPKDEGGQSLSSGGLSRGSTPIVLSEKTPKTPKKPKKSKFKEQKIADGKIDVGAIEKVAKYKMEHQEDKDVLEIFDDKARESQKSFYNNASSKHGSSRNFMEDDMRQSFYDGNGRYSQRTHDIVNEYLSEKPRYESRKVSIQEHAFEDLNPQHHPFQTPRGGIAQLISMAKQSSNYNLSPGMNKSQSVLDLNSRIRSTIDENRRSYQM
ncbi:unnamed protein product [Moneuplotes crassus]|uniref:Uncharacterized protein n=1 Tax=Euplotes crassus TaxID=5936 RepID=A0AAD1Y0R5_EUPCR|nr:unnamed protein product [Moneuplotes crassus]